MSSTAMDTRMRGFSFMPESKVERTMDLQYIEGAELERTWKSSRRQRLRQQEQKIWEEFVKEQDVLSSVCEEDPYQFLEQLPESYLKELMELELHKMKKETEQEKQDDCRQEPTQCGNGDSPRDCDSVGDSDRNCDNENDECDMFHIFDDEKDDEQSGLEEEAVHDSSNSPCTVRDKQEEKALSPHSPPLSPDMGSSKSSENVSSMIESSIYYAKIRDLRMKINEEILAITKSLEQQDILTIDPEQLIKMCRRSTEFCARFTRIYMYQLHRQMHELQRHSAASLPLARHTQYRAQAARAASLHHNLLQALLVFHKSLEQTACIRESSDLARNLSQVCVEMSQVCRAVPTPKHLSSESDLYNDDMMATCEKLEEVLGEYSAKMTDYINSANNTNTSHSKGASKASMKKRSIGTWSKSGTKIKSSAESRLSMYSLDTLRASFPARPSSSKDNQSGGTSKVRVGVSSRKQSATAPPKSSRRSPRSRRPLMRAPGDGRRRPVPDHDIATMVQGVAPCASSHMSCEASPRSVPTPQHSRRNTPRKSPIPPLKSSIPPLKSSIPPLKAPITSRKSPITPNKSPITPRKSPISSLKSPAPTPRNKLGELRVSPRSTKDSPPIKLSVGKDPLASEENSRERIEEVAKMLSARDQQARSSPAPAVQEQTLRDKTQTLDLEPARCEVTRIVRQLCGGDTAGSRNERVSGAKNAQLYCVSGNSPRQPSTPQLLRILEETIQKKVPTSFYKKTLSAKSLDRFRLALNIPEQTADRLFQYRTKFVQHMLTSPMYANCTVGKPWELIGSVSEQLIDELLLQCAKEMELNDVIQELYKTETC